MRVEVIKKFGEEKLLATAVVAFLKEKNVTYGEAIEALKDAQSFLERASLKNQV